MSDANEPKPRLLFVEDEAILREHLAQKLSDQYLVDTAGNGNEALLAVMRAKPALVVSDIVMPDMDGVELLKTLRQSPGTRAIPVLLISGRAADEYRIEGFEQGADGFLAKPYTERELRALIGSMLRSAQLRAETVSLAARDHAQRQAALERELQRTLAQLHGREQQLREHERQLALELNSTQRLHDLMTRLLGCRETQTALDEVLQASVALLGVDMGLVQLVDQHSGTMHIAVHRGFPEDPSLAGFPVVQSTPITSRKGELLGVLSAHSRNPCRFSTHQLRMMDLYARHAADFLEHAGHSA